MISDLQWRTKIVIALMLGSFPLLQCGKIPIYYILVSGPGIAQKFRPASYDWRTGCSPMYTSNYHPVWERWRKPLPNRLSICPICFKWYCLEVFRILNAVTFSQGDADEKAKELLNRPWDIKRNSQLQPPHSPAHKIRLPESLGFDCWTTLVKIY